MRLLLCGNGSEPRRIRARDIVTPSETIRLSGFERRPKSLSSPLEDLALIGERRRLGDAGGAE